jgi:hypothetical protein
VQEDFLAVIRADETETLLVVVELDLAGWHGDLFHMGELDQHQPIIVNYP